MSVRPGLIFDLDGTLVDSAPDIHAVVNRVLAQQDLPPLPFDQVKSFIGNGVGVLITRCLAAHGLAANAAELMRLTGLFEVEYESAVHLTTLNPGVSVALQTLADERFPMAICTNKPSGPTRAVLGHFDLARFFPVVVGGDTLATRKPDPAPLRHAMAELGASEVIFVGDSEVDAATAQAAGVRFWLFDGGYRNAAPEDLGAERIFSDFRQLADRLRQT